MDKVAPNNEVTSFQLGTVEEDWFSVENPNDKTTQAARTALASPPPQQIELTQKKPPLSQEASRLAILDEAPPQELTSQAIQASTTERIKAFFTYWCKCQCCPNTSSFSFLKVKY